MKSSSRAMLLSAALLAACTGGSNNTAQDAQIVQIAENLKQSGNMSGAIAVLQQAQLTHPDDPLILSQLGYALIADGQPQDAEIVFDRLIKVKPEAVSGYNGKAVALDRIGDHDGAEELYQQALKFSPNSTSIKNNLAMSMILNNQPDQAIALLEPLNQQASTPTIRQNLALAYGIKGDKEIALALNRQDLPEDEAQQNMRFYAKYAREHKKPLAHNDKMPPAVPHKMAASKPAAPDADNASSPETLDDLLSDAPPAPAAPHKRKAEPVAAVAPVQAEPDTKSEDDAGIDADANTDAKEPSPHAVLTPDHNPPSPAAGKKSTATAPTSALIKPPAPHKETPSVAKNDTDAPKPVASEDKNEKSDDSSFSLNLTPDPTYPSQSKPAGLSPNVLPTTLPTGRISSNTGSTAPVQNKLGSKMQDLAPLAGGNMTAADAEAQKPHHKHKKKKVEEPLATPPVPVPPSSFLGIPIDSHPTYPSQGKQLSNVQYNVAAVPAPVAPEAATQEPAPPVKKHKPRTKMQNLAPLAGGNKTAAPAPAASPASSPAPAKDAAATTPVDPAAKKPVHKRKKKKVEETAPPPPAEPAPSFLGISADPSYPSQGKR